MIQNEILLITLAGLGIVTLGFVYVIMQAGKPADPSEVQKTSYFIRRWWFWILIVAGIGISWATLKPFPIPVQNSPPQAPQVVDVVGYQWYWTLSQTQLTAGSPVEFRITSADVNHGFAIYGPNGRIVIQSQAMPNYTNILRYSFSAPGTYRVLCLEYCGLAHHAMQAEFTVVVADTEQGS